LERERKEKTMAADNMVFGIYQTAPAVEEAVDELLATGFAGEMIFVLHPKNKDTVEFANRKHIHLPSGTGDVPTAELPLDGTIGIADPVGHRHGIAHWLLDPLAPHEGALYAALADMRVPGEWCNKRVVRGNCLISVKCDSWEKFFQAIGVLKFTDAKDTSSSVSLEEYRAKRNPSVNSGKTGKAAMHRAS
jgi:hypothetical protein